MKNIAKRITAILAAAVVAFPAGIVSLAYDDDYDDDYDYDSYYYDDEDEYASDDDSELSDILDSLPKKPDTSKNKEYDYSATDVNTSLFNGSYYYKENAYFLDEAGVYGSASDIENLKKSVQSTADKIGMNVGVFIGGRYRTDNQTRTFTKNAIIKLFGNDKDTNSVFLYLDFEGHKPSYDYICTQHDAKLYYTDGTAGLSDRISEIIEDMYEVLPASGEPVRSTSVTQGIDKFLKNLEEFKQKGYPLDICYFNEEKGVYRYNLLGTIIEQKFRPYKYWIVFLALGIFIGILIAIGSEKSIKKKYKFRETISASAYASKNRKKFTRQEDNFLTQHTTSYKIESSSSGGGGGGGFSGGGSFGGGGGHR